MKTIILKGSYKSRFIITNMCGMDYGKERI